MILDTQFSSVAEERWSEISGFPGYEVSDQGRVVNLRTELLVTPTVNTRNLYMVGLMQDGVQRKRSLPLLVARAFVPRPKDVFDTPINLNGDRSNNTASNLAWRPLWFARKYNGQFNDNHVTFPDPIEDVETYEQYKNSMHASTTHGLLDNEIVLSMINNTYVWPTGQIFREAVQR